MPFDGLPQDYETKPDVFSVEGLIAWLETQPGETEYAYYHGYLSDCLLQRYFDSTEIPVKWINRTSVDLVGGGKIALPGGEYGALNETSREEPWTYSAALLRARSLLSSTAE